MATMTRKKQRDLIDLTDREEEVLKLVAEGWTNNRIATELTLSERTVRFHLTNIYDKLGVASRAEAISWAIKRGKK
jgi:DNA-binding NarL/FixJ family response regulator